MFSIANEKIKRESTRAQTSLMEKMKNNNKKKRDTDNIPWRVVCRFVNKTFSGVQSTLVFVSHR
jgi:hypothetical protein